MGTLLYIMFLPIIIPIKLIVGLFAMIGKLCFITDVAKRL